MRILISGASGLIGSELVPYLRKQGHEVIKLVRDRKEGAEDEIPWDPDAEKVNVESLEGFDAGINLSGYNIFSGRWTQARKDKIRRSRVTSTRTLAKAFASLEHPPEVLINASAMGYYGDRGATVVTEEALSGSSFLASVCREWEAATLAAKQRGIRVVYLRTSIVLSPKGGALGKMLPLFKLGLGGVLGSGKQYMSWISIEDYLRSISHLLNKNEIKGPVNISTPNPVTNSEFTKTLGRVLNRPTFLSVPSSVIRFVAGELGDAFLTGVRMEPQRLEQSGFTFEHPQLEEALKALLK